MFNLILVATGGATGAVLRFILTNLSKYLFASNVYGTLSVNILGSFLIVGLLGSFTTFSAFSYEALSLIMEKKIFVSVVYILFSISVCILSAYFGIIINK